MEERKKLLSGLEVHNLQPDPPQEEQVPSAVIQFAVPKLPVEIRITFDPSNLNSVRVAAPQFVMMNKAYVHFLLSMAMESVHNLHFKQQQELSNIIPGTKEELKEALNNADLDIALKNRKLLGID